MLIAPIEVNYFGKRLFRQAHGKGHRIGRGHRAHCFILGAEHNIAVFPYACSKAVLDCLVRYAALEYGPKKIRVNSILPGAIRSEATRELWAIPGMEESFARDVPLGRIGEPADFADAVLWLASATYVTGTPPNSPFRRESRPRWIFSVPPARSVGPQ